MTTKTYPLSHHWLMAVVVLLLAVLFGLVASLGNPLIALFLAALVISVVLVASPLMLLWLVVVGGLILAGVAELYLPAIRQARWGVVIASVALGIIALLIGAWKQKSDHRDRSKPWSAVAIWAVLFFVVAIFSGFLNLGMTLDTVIGFKGYFQVWGILLAFALLPLRPVSVERFMAFLVWLGLLQFPFILHQQFVLVPQRSGLMDAAKGIVAQDVLAGTFSASMTGGSAGAAMAVLLLVALVMSIALWRAGKLSKFRLAAVSMIFLVPLAIGELKIALVLLPIGLYIIFEDKVRRNPLRAMGLLSISAFLMIALFVVFTILPRAGATRSLTPDEYWQEMWSYNLGDRGYGNAVLNRTTVYPFWVKYQQTSGGSIVNTLVGYGPGVSKDTRGSLTEHSLAAERFPGYGIGLTGISGLLWDVGILGTLAALGFFVSAYQMARHLVCHVQPGTLRWVHLKGAEAGVAMMGLSLLHNNMFLYEIGFQTLLMLLVGYLLYVRRSPDSLQAATNISPHE